MYIEQITLENIKSYGSPSKPIKFGEGVNLIAGMNGAGKSTILEAIGFVLFDTLPYKQTDFVRRGKSGQSKIVVQIRTNDNKCYDIERTIPSSYVVYDVDENINLGLESKEEVLDWIKQYLAVEQSTDLSALFENAVGMQQGTITSVFLATASIRKKTFDALLRVEDYNDAWTNLRDTENHITGLLTENKTSLAVAKNTIDNLRDKPQEAEILQSEIESNENELIIVSEMISELSEELEKLDALSKKTDDRKRMAGELRKAQENYAEQETKIVDISPQVEERSRLDSEIERVEGERQQIDEQIEQHNLLLMGLEETYQQAVTVFEDVENEWDGFQETVKETARLSEQQNILLERKIQIETDLVRREELNELITQVEIMLNDATKQKTESQAKLKTNEERLSKLQKMRELLGVEGAKCPVCQQEMDGVAHSEALQYYDDEEREISQQGVHEQTRLKEAETTIIVSQNSKNTYEEELRALANDKALEDIESQIEANNYQLQEKSSDLEDKGKIESKYQTAKKELESAKVNLEEHNTQGKELNQERNLFSDTLNQLNKDVARLPSQKLLDDEQQRLESFASALKEIEQALADLADLPDYDEALHAEIKKTHEDAIAKQASLQTQIENDQKALHSLQGEIEKLRIAEEHYNHLEFEATVLENRQTRFKFVRKTIREAGPRIRERKVRLVSEVASGYFNEIVSDYSMHLKWDADDYGISIEQGGEERPFPVLSGGEQMIAALSVRLALLTHLTKINLIFLDEPTINLDDNRRIMLSSQLSKIRDLQQLFVISHDDTFVEESDHVIEVEKVDDVSLVKVE